jgi:hypothetical protein
LQQAISIAGACAENKELDIMGPDRSPLQLFLPIKIQCLHPTKKAMMAKEKNKESSSRESVRRF